MKKLSFHIKLILIMAALIMGTLCIVLISNIVFLSSFYTMSKINSLGRSYDLANSIYSQQYLEDEQQISDEDALKLERLGANSGISMYVFSVSDAYEQFEFNFGSVFPQRAQIREVNISFPQYYTDIEKKDVSNCVNRYIMGNDPDSNYKQDTEKEHTEHLSSGGDYNIYKVYNNRIESYYIELFGNLQNGSYIYIRSNFESMKESVGISNRFLIYVGLLVLFVAVVIMWFAGRSFTKPILELSEIARRMANLDFTARYTGHSQDEIGVLGESMNHLSEQLEHTIQELKVANNELRMDIENKTQIDEMRKEFLSNVSHELKTPIALIQGYAEGLLDNISEDKESRDFYCEVIVDEANKMNKMVKKLLSLNQIEFGNNQVEINHFDIVPVIRSVLSSVEILAEQKQANIIFKQEEPVFVWADEYMIEEVITNYVSNSLNHVDGEKQIYIRIVHKQDVARVSVFNTGARIPEEDIEKIWIKFYKVDKARTREYGGSGIGLSIVSAIMAAHNRACGVINRENGVEFWFEVDTKNV